MTEWEDLEGEGTADGEMLDVWGRRMLMGDLQNVLVR